MKMRESMNEISDMIIYYKKNVVKCKPCRGQNLSHVSIIFLVHFRYSNKQVDDVKICR